MFFSLSKIIWFFATPSNLLAGVLFVGCALLITGRTQRIGRIATASATAAILILGFLPIGNWLLLPLEQRFSVSSDHSGEIDGVIVLGGAVDPGVSFARGQLTVSEGAERIIAMADLARRNPQAKVVFAGGAGALVTEEHPEAGAVEKFLPTLGVATERVQFEKESRNTHENAHNVRALLGNTAGRWLLVTSAFHMPRAIGCFRQAGLTVVPYPVDYRTRGSRETVQPFSNIAEGLARTDLAVKEWVGLLAYYLSGKTSQFFPGPGAGQEW